MKQNRQKVILGTITLLAIAICGIVAWELQLGRAQLGTQNNITTIRPFPDEARITLPLVDGAKIGWLGVFHDSPTVGGLKSFHSKELGISLKYPDDYLLFENEGGEGISAFHSIQIAPKKPILLALSHPTASESPASIGLTFYSKPELLSLETWMREDESHSNFHASDPSNNLTSTTVAGLPAFKYHSSFGLYDSEYVAFRYSKWMVLAATPVALKMEGDFQKVLSSLIFQSK